MAVRRLLADALSGALAGAEDPSGRGRSVRIVADARTASPGEGDLALVQLVRNTAAPAEHSPIGQLTSTFEVWVALASNDSAASEDALDDALDLVIEALESIGFVDWEKAERSTLGDGFVAWKISPVTVALAKE